MCSSLVKETSLIRTSLSNCLDLIDETLQTSLKDNVIIHGFLNENTVLQNRISGILHIFFIYIVSLSFLLPV